MACFNFGFAIYRWTTLQNAVREGCRYAITFQAPSGHQDTDVKLKVQAFSMGMLDASLTGSSQQIFVNYFDPTVANGTDRANALATGGNTPGNLVEVSAKLDLASSWIAPLSGKFNDSGAGYHSFTIQVYSSAQLGGLPYGVTSVAR